jgi:hypothetical protein
MALITKEEVKEQLSISASTTVDDAYITNLCLRVSAFMKRYIGMSIEQESLTEYYDGNGEPSLYVRSVPVIAINAVYESYDQTWDATTLIDSDDYIVDLKIGRIYRLGDVPFLLGVQNVRVIYDAGYAAVPDDIKMVAIDLVSAKYNRRKAAGISSRSLADGSITYFTSNSLTGEQKELLAMYRKAKVLA